MDTTHTFHYQRSPLLSAIGVFLCFCGAAYCLPAAEVNTRSYVTKYGIELTVEQTTMGLYAIGVGAIVLGIYTFLVLLRSVATKQQVVLTSTDVSAPETMLHKKPTVVPYTDIKKLKIRSSQGTKILHVHHTDGVLKISRQMCRNRREFNQITKALTERTA